MLEYLVDTFKHILLAFKLENKALQTIEEELLVVTFLNDWVSDITNQVLEEGSDHNVNDLAQNHVDCVLQVGSLMVEFEVNSTGDELLRCINE